MPHGARCFSGEPYLAHPPVVCGAGEGMQVPLSSLRPYSRPGHPTRARTDHPSRLEPPQVAGVPRSLHGYT